MRTLSGTMPSLCLPNATSSRRSSLTTTSSPNLKGTTMMSQRRENLTEDTGGCVRLLCLRGADAGSIHPDLHALLRLRQESWGCACR